LVLPALAVVSKDVRGALKQNSTLPIQVEELFYRLLDFPTDWNPLAIAIWVRDAKDQTSWTMVHGERYCSPHLGNGFDECGAELSLDLPLLVQKVRHFAGSRHQHDLPGRFARGEQLVRLGGLSDGNLRLDADFQFALADHVQHGARAGEELLARRYVGDQRRPREVERAARAESLRIERRHRSARPTEQ